MSIIGIKNVSETLTILIANTTASGVQLADMSGATISGYAGIGGADYYPLSEYFSFASINASEEVSPLVASGTLVVNDGLKDLTATEGLKHIRYATAFEAELIYEDQVGATSFTELVDTPAEYDADKYLRSTVSGSEWVTISGVDVEDGVHIIEHGNSESESTTTSTLYQQKFRLTTSEVPAGDYLVMWYYEWQYKHGSFDFKGRVQLDDVTDLMEHNTEPTKTDNWTPVSGFKRETLVSGSHYIDVDYCSSKSGEEAKIRSVRLEFWGV